MTKGVSIQQVPTIMTIIMLIGVFVGVAYISLSSFQETQYTVTTATNDTTNFVANNTFYDLDNPYLTGLNAVSYVGNNTITLGSGNYTVQQSGYHYYQIKLVIVQAGLALGNYNVTYTYNRDNKASLGIGYVLTLVDNIVTNFGTVGTMIFVGILITVVFWMVASGRIGGKKGKGGA